MLKKKYFFKKYNLNSKKLNNNLKKTKIAYSNLKFDIQNYKIPMLQSFKKNYFFDFSSETIKKFSKYKNIIIIGMGGSALGAKCIYNFFKVKIKKKVFFFDNLDENLYLEFKKLKKLKSSCFVIISKSGETIESITNLSILFSNFLIKNKLIFITEIRNNSIINIAKKLNAEIIEHRPFISGRYSVLSEAGMFPAALMGLDIKKFKILDQLINDKNFVSSLIQNVAYIYWYQQLVSESLGKKGKGITTIIAEAPKDHHSTMQLYLDGPKDKFFTFFNSKNKKGNLKVAADIIQSKIKFLKNKKLRSIINAQCRAVKNIFKIKKIPFREISFNKKNEKELGVIFIFFVLETLLLAKLMKVNPFDQPAVEQIKVETKKILS